MNFKIRAGRLKTDIPAVFIAMKKKETPVTAKIIAGLTIVYALSPIDLIPDFIPVLGYLDDILLLPALVALTIRLIPPDIFAASREEAEGLWAGGKPKKWYYALPVVLMWLLIVYLIAGHLIQPSFHGKI
nr:YkvA family protein [uncultured Clostridium sp.]